MRMIVNNLCDGVEVVFVRFYRDHDADLNGRFVEYHFFDYYGRCCTFSGNSVVMCREKRKAWERLVYERNN